MIEVKLQEDSDGYITYLGYPDSSDQQKSPIPSQWKSPLSCKMSSPISSQRSSPTSSQRSSPESSGSDRESPVILGDKKKLDESNSG